MKIALLLAVMTAITGNLAESPTKGTSSGKQQVTQQATGNTPSIAIVVQNQQSAAPQATPAPKSPSGNTPAEWALVGVGIITFIVIGWQSIETHRSANAAITSAKAAVDSFDTLTRYERPRLSIAFDKPEINPRNNWFHFSVVNNGRNPAEIYYFIGGHGFWKPDAESRDYPLSSGEFGHKKFLSRDDPPFEIYDFMCEQILDELWADNRKEGKRLFLFGHVLYRDLVTRESHEIRFCYWLSLSDGVGLVSGGSPPGWNDHT